jgi:secondary thiamine-phosphate synthase enzyme
MAQRRIQIETQGPGLYAFTAEAEQFVRGAGVGEGADEGLLTCFVRHTSCSLVIQENADPDVHRDLQGFFRRLVPPGDDPSMGWLRHTTEGPDDMPAHIRAALTAVSIGVPVAHSKMLLGIWQGLYLFEHRDAPHRREIVLHLSR